MNAPKKGRKSPASRDAQTGQFEAASPLTDPQLADFAVQTVRSIQHLEPLLASLAKGLEDEQSRNLAALAGLYLSLIKGSFLQELAADPESLAEVKKKRVEARRLGNMPLAEVQRIQALAEAWQALPSAAQRMLAGATPAGGLLGAGSEEVQQ